jgi:hypothetical protein
MTMALVAAVGLAVFSLVSGTGKAPAADAAASAPAGGVKVVAASIEETRTKALITDSNYGAMSSLRVVLNVTGGDAAEAKRIGPVKVDSAVDDQKGDLVSKDKFSFGSASGFETIDQFRQVKGGFRVDMQLTPGARTAKSIAKLTGSVTAIVGGKETPVVVPDVTSILGKAVENAILKKAGVTLAVLDPKDKKVFGAGAGANLVAYTLEGNAGVVLNVELVDDKGAVVPTMGGSSQMGNGPVIRELTVQSKTLPDKAGLKITVLEDAKTVTVPIDLKDIPLP